MTSTGALTHRFYRQGRRHGLAPDEALRYSHDRMLLWDAESPLWFVDVDDGMDFDYPALMIVLVDEHDNVLEMLGGVDVEFMVSDHGNVICDVDDPHLVGLAADLVRTYNERQVA